MRKGAYGVARVGAGKRARGDGLGSYAPGEGVCSLFCLGMVGRKVGIIHHVASERQLRLGGARVARKQTRRHREPAKNGKAMNETKQSSRHVQAMAYRRVEKPWLRARSSVRSGAGSYLSTRDSRLRP